MQESEKNTSWCSEKNIVRAALWVALFASLVTASAGFWLYSYVNTPAEKLSQASLIVVIPKGSSVKRIGEILGEAGLVKNDIRFSILTRLKEKVNKLQAGEFRLTTGLKPGELIDQLVNAVPVQHSVTIPEGLKIEEIAAIFAEKGWCDQQKFVQLAHDRQFIKGLGIPRVSSLEGYLFPETYNLTRDMQGAPVVITMMVNLFKRVWAEQTETPLEDIKSLEQLTLASIVEKETGQAGERAKIAGVFTNRLKKGMRLQSDPTVVYGLKEFSGKITRKNLKEKHPYNTYVIRGLPPGPICNPGREAIKAVLSPEEHKFYYFVAKNDGTHKFSKSLKEHNRAVYKYQRSSKKSK